MNNKINDIINRYKNYEQLYSVLKNYYKESEISPEEYEECIKKIKKIIASYYLYKYEFKTYSNNEKQDRLLSKISEICNLEKKVKIIGEKIKIYPVKEKTENIEEYYERIIMQMVDYQIETNMHIEDIFDKYEKLFDYNLKEYKKELKNKDMHLYYGSPYYMIERAKFIAECIKFIPNISLNIDELINTIISFESKYLNNREAFSKDDDFIVDDEQFYKDYDLIESCYKKLLAIENDLAPIVMEYWKNYLTNPNQKNDYYRYITHSFSGDMTDPNLMNKACCSLSTNEIENLMYGNSGLIYELDAESVETMSTCDVGSWVLNKNEFIERGCPGSWQLTETEGQTVFYEYPRNSKLIMPEVFEKECKRKILNGASWSYSEFFLNKKAKPIGVFYTDSCENIEEVEAYAKKYNLPLVNVYARTNRNTNHKSK